MATILPWVPIKLDTFMAIMPQAISRANSGQYVISGCSVHEETPNTMYVRVDAGIVMTGASGNVYTAVSQTDLLLVSDGSNPRFYTIYVDTTGTPQAYQGTAAAISPIGETVFAKMETPAPGDSCPAGVPLAVVYLATSATSVTNAVIRSVAQFGGANPVACNTFTTTAIALGRNTAGAGIGEEVTLTQMLDWIGSATRGDILSRGASTWQRFAGVEQGSICYEASNLDLAWLIHGNYGDRVCSAGHGANPFMAGADGWTPAGVTFTYVSSDAPTYVFKVSGVDVTDRMWVGMKVKLTDNSAVKYFFVTAIAFSTDTTITIYGGTDYTLAGGTITLPFYSMGKAPKGFPLDPAKWTVSYADTTGYSKTSGLASNVWYKDTGFGTAGAMSIPIGIWHISWKCDIGIVGAPTLGLWTYQGTLTATDGTVGTAALTSYANIEAIATGGYVETFTTSTCSSTIALAAKTSYYFEILIATAASTYGLYTNIGLIGVVSAVCAYL